MTLQLRPTFSESWYRVANLRAKLRAGAQISRQFYRGERWYVVRDPAGNQYHRLSDAAYRFVGLLDGTRTVEQAWELVGGTLEDDAPTQPEVIQIMSHLYSANLIDADVTPDATVLLRRHKQLSKRKMQNRMMNVLFPRIPLWDPDKFLKRWMPLAKIGFSKFGAIVWLAVVVSAIVMLVPYWNMAGHSLKAAAESSYDLRSNPINAFYLWVVFCLIKFVHELGHAFSCRRFGGECHELGIMFLVFIPTPYVDASSAWSFRNKWHRIFVGAAGMIVELFVASLCAFIWINTGDIHSLVGQLSFNAMLVASFTTIVFNANPLLRYDGYYILSDYLEIPNLRQKSTEYAMGLLKRHVFGVKLQQPLPPVLQRFWLFFYAVASSIYRTFVGIVIILMVAFQIPILGLFMAIGGVATWAVVPVYKTFKYLTIDPELHRKRGRAIAFTLTTATAAVILFAIIPFPMNVDASALAEAEHHESVRPEWSGFVRKIVAKDHQWVKGNVYDQYKKVVTPGDVIFIADDPELDNEIEKDTRQVKLYQDKITADQSVSLADVKGDEAALAAYQFELNTLLDRREKLTVRAPIDGILIAPNLTDMVGRYVKNGDEVAMVMDPKRLMLRVLTEQKEIGVLTSKDSRNPQGRITDLHTEVRLASDVSTVLYGEHPQLQVQATTKAIKSLNNTTGDDIQVDPKHPDKLMNPEFEIDVPVINPDSKYVPGQKAWVRFKLAPRSLLWQGYRRLQQLLQTKQTSPLV